MDERNEQYLLDKIDSLQARVSELEGEVDGFKFLRKLNAIFIKDAPVFIAAISPNGRIRFINDIMASFLETDATDNNISDFISTFINNNDGDSISDVMHELLENRVSTLSTHMLISKSGQELLLEWLLGIGIMKRKQSEEERKKLLSELTTTVETVKILEGLLPICAGCKKIRDNEGSWNQLENYISKHSEAEFSHGICPECAKRLYPDLYPD